MHCPQTSFRWMRLPPCGRRSTNPSWSNTNWKLTWTKMSSKSSRMAHRSRNPELLRFKMQWARKSRTKCSSTIGTRGLRKAKKSQKCRGSRKREEANPTIQATAWRILRSRTQRLRSSTLACSKALPMPRLPWPHLNSRLMLTCRGKFLRLKQKFTVWSPSCPDWKTQRVWWTWKMMPPEDLRRPVIPSLPPAASNSTTLSLLWCSVSFWELT